MTLGGTAGVPSWVPACHLLEELSVSGWKMRLMEGDQTPRKRFQGSNTKMVNFNSFCLCFRKQTFP